MRRFRPLLIAVLLFACAFGAALLAQETISFAPSSSAIVFDEATANNMRALFSVGQAYGNYANVFSKVGDSITVSYHFLKPFGWGLYNLGEYDELQPVIDFYGYRRVGDGNSFSVDSAAAGVGWASWGVLDPEFADEEICLMGENPLECEYRIRQPSVALIMYGTNESGYLSPQDYRYFLERIMRLSFDWGVIPVFSTLPNRPAVGETIIAYNNEVRALTSEYHLPLWDYAAAVNGLPNFGLTYDDVHPSAPDESAFDGVLTPEYLQYGYNVRNLTALQMLDSIWRVVVPGGVTG